MLSLVKGVLIMKKSILFILSLLFILSSCSLNGTDAYIHIYNDYPVAVTLVPWTDVPGLIVDPCVTGLYVGDSETDVWGSNLMDYEIAPEDAGTVPIEPIKNKDIKITVKQKYSAGNLGLMGTHAKNFTFISQNITIEASSVHGGFSIHVPF